MIDKHREMIIRKTREIRVLMEELGYPFDITEREAVSSLYAAKDLFDIVRTQIGDVCPECKSVINAMTGNCSINCSKIGS